MSDVIDFPRACRRQPIEDDEAEDYFPYADQIRAREERLIGLVYEMCEYDDWGMREEARDTINELFKGLNRLNRESRDELRRRLTKD